MPAYWVARSRITDPEKYKRYTDRVPEIIAQFGGRVLSRGARFQILEGPEAFTRFVIIEFPSFEDGVACFNSQQYQDAAVHRRSGGGTVEIVMLEEGDTTK
jgi:uncharacterized protein (DUF1330 family)